MTTSRWSLVKRLLEQALEVPEEERASFLERVCPTDKELRHEVASLLSVSKDRLALLDRVRFELAPPSGPGRRLGPGDHLGRFRILEELEQGGMGAVYRAHDDVHGRPVAVKLLRRGGTSISERETRILARLNHGNIARLYDSGVSADGDPFFVMEYVEGETLDRYCDEHRLSIAERLRLFQKVCGAVEYAHRNQVVHRDLKPDNILVTAEGEPKLLDFGISRLLDPHGERPLAGTTVGDKALTPAFASPEQIRGEWTATTSDVYSLGVVLHVLLTGRLPYSIASGHELFWTITEVDPERPSRIVQRSEERLASDGTVRLHDAETIAGRRRLGAKQLVRRLAGDLDVIVLKALRKEPERRYRTVRELSAELGRHLDDEPVLARHASGLYRARKFLRRHSVASAIAALLLILNLGTIVGLAIAQRRAELAQRNAQAASREAAREQKRSETIARFLLDTFDASSPFGPAGEVETARDLLDRARRRIRAAELDPELRARLAADIALAYQGQGLLDEGVNLLEATLDRVRRETGQRSIATSTVMDSLGILEHKRGNLERAEELLLGALSILSESGTADEVNLGDAHDELALTLWKQGRTEEAVEHARQGISLLKRSLDPDRAAGLLASSLGNFGLMLHDLGRLEEAETVLREALERMVELRGPDHPDVATSANNLARTLMERNRFGEAAELLRWSTRLLEGVVGPDHPRLLVQKNNLAASSYYAGDFETAVSTQEGIVERMHESMGPEHGNTLASQQNLGRFMTAAGHFQDARRVLEEALEKTRGSLGRDHWLSANAGLRLGQVLVELGELERAETLIQEARSIFAETMGEGHYRTLEAESTLAGALARNGEMRRARALARQACDSLNESLGPDHWRSASATAALGEVLTMGGEYAEAERLLKQSRTTLDETLGEQSPMTRAATRALAQLYLATDRSTQARQLLASLGEEGRTGP